MYDGILLVLVGEGVLFYSMIHFSYMDIVFFWRYLRVHH
jgi:hypothetical protein